MGGVFSGIGISDSFLSDGDIRAGELSLSGFGEPGVAMADIGEIADLGDIADVGDNTAEDDLGEEGCN